VKRLFLFILFIFVFSCQENKKEIALLGQWHLLSNQNTLDIEKSMELPQFSNQKAIYLILDEWITKKKINLVLSEGCENTEITKDFKPTFNGWDYHSLKSSKDKTEFGNILTLLPLKLEAKFDDQIKIQCADSSELIKKHQLVFSDIKGHIGFLSRLKEAKEKNNQKLFDLYSSKLKEISKDSFDDPIEYCVKKIKFLLKEEQKFINQRNDFFIQTLNKHTENKVAIIIGYRHIEDLQIRLTELGHKVSVPSILESTLPQDNLEKRLIESLEF